MNGSEPFVSCWFVWGGYGDRVESRLGRGERGEAVGWGAERGGAVGVGEEGEVER